MAAGRLPTPGSEYGPCEAACQHTDCKLTRDEAESPCSICDKAIGFDVRFYKNPDGNGLVHAQCLES